MESNLNIASVLHSLLQVLVLVNLPNVKDSVLVKIDHGDSLCLEAVLASLHHLNSIVGVSLCLSQGTLVQTQVPPNHRNIVNRCRNNSSPTDAGR